ncbi:hypothetical protein [Sphingomonas oligophenolica]|nr:hypothetical protein [Sphingomonas oligophenolica]
MVTITPTTNAWAAIASVVLVTVSTASLPTPHDPQHGNQDGEANN